MGNPPVAPSPWLRAPVLFCPFVQKEARRLLETPQLSLWRFSPGSFPAGAPSQPQPTPWLGPHSSRGDPSVGNLGIRAGADPRDRSKGVAVFESFRPALAAPPVGLGGGARFPLHLSSGSEEPWPEMRGGWGCQLCEAMCRRFAREEFTRLPKELQSVPGQEPASLGQRVAPAVLI